MAAKNGKARLVGVMGDPITHSLSPAIHEFWLRQYDINGAYVPLRVPSVKFEAALRIYADTGFVGFNVTLPHKQAAYDMMDSCDDAAALCRAVNTIIVQKNGTLHGMNTDAYGFTRMVEEEQAQAEFSLDKVLLLGAGGSARAVIFALQQLGCHDVLIANRTQARTEELMEDMHHDRDDMRMEAITLDAVLTRAKEVNCIVNTLSIGQDAGLHLENIMKTTSDDCMVMDVSYGYNGTEMTRAAHKMKRRQCDGLSMLLAQAVPGFEQWFGVTPEVNEALTLHVRAVAGGKR